MDDWTPGPWTHQGPPDLYSDDPIVVGPDLKLVASVRDEANARLISLAPEMAEFIERWTSWRYGAMIDDTIATPAVIEARRAVVQELYDAARDLLARARSEA